MARPIIFISDYGLDDEFVGVCHAVMSRTAPQARVIDLTHAILPQDVLRAALVLRQALPYLPSDAVLLAVVDPGVGSERRPVAVRAATGDRLLVGPDNGVLSLAWGEGDPAGAVEITSAEVLLRPLSRTFHGRDVFAPAAARLAAGWSLERLGPVADLSSLSRVEIPQVEVDAEGIHAEVLAVDRYGNVQTSARRGHVDTMGGPLEVVTPSGAVPLWRAETFAEVAEGQLAVIVDSGGWVSMVLNRGSAAEVLGLTAGDPIVFRPRGVG
ncbi:MAG TPA: SAM-dependent chlorinase/fluorinase [Actinomycetota bacterium]